MIQLLDQLISRNALIKISIRLDNLNLKTILHASRVPKCSIIIYVNPIKCDSRGRSNPQNPLKMNNIR